MARTHFGQISVMHHTLSGIPLICHLAFQIMVHSDTDEQIIWLKLDIIVSVEIRLTGKCPRCYVLDNEYAGGGDSWQLAQVHSLHSDGLIPVRATATQCPSRELKIVTEAKNSGELCSLKAALTWPHSANTLWSFPYTGQSLENWKVTRLYIRNYNMSSSRTLLFYCQILSCPR